MAYSDFSLRKVKQDFNLTLIEGGSFLPSIQSLAPSQLLIDQLADGVPLALATGSEKARSELIISPVLMEVRRQLDRQISLFSGEDFTIAPELGLSGTCDFLLSRSPEQMLIEAPTVIIVEARKADLKTGIGQCLAEMVAAQKFNEANRRSIPTIYGCVTSGSAWKFMQLQGQTATFDLMEYAIPPIDRILGMLVWMVKN
ncbi:MAG: hypothetical protein KME10_07145 [Plectolyngbya sp. WJT66-NPBG17]|jgi:hypothetical protein|nr:hypothetical protein [Plectolyngbya sp. WJT66-NPBG17]